MSTGVFLPGIGVVGKLGRVLPKTPSKTLLLDQFVKGKFPDAPESADFTLKVPDWPMYANDQYGCCVFSCIGHQIGLWTANESGLEKMFTDSAILGMYSRVTGFDPRYPSTDNGAVIDEALRDWVLNGLDGHKLAGFVNVRPDDSPMMRFGFNTFGGAHLGIMLPAAWQAQTGPGKVWDIGPSQRGQWSPGSWGGHAVDVVKYDKDGVDVITWSRRQRMSWRAFGVYCDQVTPCASWDWCVDDETPSSIKKAHLIAYFGALGGGPLTPPPVPPEPTPPPVPPDYAHQITLDLGRRLYQFPPDWKPYGE